MLLDATSAREPEVLDDPVPAALRRLTGRFERGVMDIPGGRARIRLAVGDEKAWDAIVTADGANLRPAERRIGSDALLRADAASWQRVADDVRGGMAAFRADRLSVRRNLHLGVGFLAATSGDMGPGRLRFESVRTRKGELSILSAGEGEPVICIHGLGATKASFLPTVAALADSHRVIALDLPGFGDSCKPLAAPYNARYFASAVTALMDSLGIRRAHLVGNSMGGRVAIEVGLRRPHAIGGIVLLSPALAWLSRRRLVWLLRAPLPKLGLLQPTPRALTEPIIRRLVPGGTGGWAAAGVDEFLRSYLTARGRHAFYEAARNIYLDEPHGENGLWTRMAKLAPQTMFVWGREDSLVPIAFMKHVERTLPAARHVELDCGHVPQLEHPDATHAAISEFLAGCRAKSPARRPGHFRLRRDRGKPAGEVAAALG